jgi:murein DD-endopeptidase MepM/ murein hydrolase activator NlpD
VTPPQVIEGGVFPVGGPHSYGGDGSKFGAERDDHIHEGQDIPAAEGTPVLAPVAGTIRSTDVQSEGAGWYVVLDGDDGRSFFFAHCQAHTFAVVELQRISPGQQLCRVGTTGTSSGPHLHFEIWPGGWRISKDSKPVDPLPQLLAWDPDY